MEFGFDRAQTSVPKHYHAVRVPSLAELSNRVICLQVFRANIRWRDLRDVVFDLKMQLKYWELPKVMKNSIHDGLGEVFRELARWTDKHVQMMPDTAISPRTALVRRGFKRVHRGEHLRMFYDYIVWCTKGYQIDDLQTAKQIALRGCSDWPQMKFQFACCYVMKDLIENDYLFDKIRRRCFWQQIGDHPVYAMWLTILDQKDAFRRMFRDDRVVLDQRISLVFQFAIVNGYIEIVRFLWNNLTPQQQEAVGFLWWKKLCNQAKHREMIRFLCHNLCKINFRGMVRLTWDSFYHKIYTIVQDEYTESISDRRECLRQLECLLESWCPRLRAAILKRERYKAVTTTFVYNQTEAFALLLDYMNEGMLKSAREYIDRAYGRKPDNYRKNMRNMIIYKQMSVDY